MRRSATAVVVCFALAVLLALAPLLVAPAAGHDINHLSADPQVSANGTVVLETTYATEDGFVVLYRDWDGSSGEVVGVTPFSASRADVTEVPVPVDESVWPDLPTNTTLTAVLHGDDDGDGQFDPETDAALSSFGQPAQATFTVRKGTGAAYVSAAGIAAQRATERVRVREVALDEPGHLVLRTSEGGEPGRVLGSVSLDAGTHENVSVPLNGTLPDEKFAVFAMAYTDSGSVPGEFDGNDRPVLAGDAYVATRFTVDPTPDPGTPTPALVNTPTASPTSGSGTGTPDEPGTTADGGSARPTSPGGETGGAGGGFGIVVAVVAVTFTVLAVSLRRR